VKINRIIVVLPLVAGLILAGTALARMLPAETVRDSAYPACKHNGVHFNKQGHANCGLHKGWANQEPGDETGNDVSGDEAGANATGADEKHAKAEKQAKAEKRAKAEKHAKHEKHANGAGASQRESHGGSSHAKHEKRGGKKS
jgi:hypothetical protein